MSKLNAIISPILGASEPVRKIGIQSRSITGTMPNGNRYESSLERDLMILLDFDPFVYLYSPQPLTIPYQTPDGKWHHYTPDGLIEWHQDVPIHDKRPILVEVKYREAFKGEFRSLMPKFRAATKFAQEQDWVFQIFTEDRIRTPFLSNAKFLTSYKVQRDVPMEQLIEDSLRNISPTTPQTLMTHLFRDKWNQAKLIPIIWGMIARREIACDLSLPLTMATEIWSI